MNKERFFNWLLNSELPSPNKDRWNTSEFLSFYAPPDYYNVEAWDKHNGERCRQEYESGPWQTLEEYAAFKIDQINKKGIT